MWKVRLKNASVGPIWPEFALAFWLSRNLHNMKVWMASELRQVAAGVAVPHLGNLLFWIKVWGQNLVNSQSPFFPANPNQKRTTETTRLRTSRPHPKNPKWTPAINKFSPVPLFFFYHGLYNIYLPLLSWNGSCKICKDIFAQPQQLNNILRAFADGIATVLEC